MTEMGRMLIVLGGLLLVVGLLLSLGTRVPWLGRLPGDIVYRKGNFTFYFPLATSLLVSLILTAVLALFHRR
jgi:membrane protein implicated in regulation of membrane protease activity